MNEQEKSNRVGWLFRLTHFDGDLNQIGGVAYRAAERAVRNRIGAERLKKCGSRPYRPFDEYTGQEFDLPMITEYDPDRLAIDLEVQREYYLTMGIDIDRE